MSKEISTPAMVALVAIVLVIIGVVGYRVFRSPKSGWTAEQQKESMKHMIAPPNGAAQPVAAEPNGMPSAMGPPPVMGSGAMTSGSMPMGSGAMQSGPGFTSGPGR